MMKSKFLFFSIITIQLICIFFLAINLILVRWEIRENFALQVNLIEQNEELTNQHNQLLTEQFFLDSPARIEKIAKQQLGMVQKKPLEL